ncbi:hypothetical protein TSUD_246810 [Trifolium subterraneum]|uniref:Uncharacterized protein n=1 Tax=Trifolium subterraneum TaxID=3900 RepID=A0A2Z6NH80_TRISU|nr:hypothetical protein TSUD_246810 [Trifolium subterraneum]
MYQLISDDKIRGSEIPPCDPLSHFVTAVTITVHLSAPRFQLVMKLLRFVMAANAIVAKQKQPKGKEDYTHTSHVMEDKVALNNLKV